MTYPNGGQRDENHPNRKVDREAFGGAMLNYPWMGGPDSDGDSDGSEEGQA